MAIVIKTSTTRTGRIIDLWQAPRPLEKKPHAVYAATVRTRGFENEPNGPPEGAWVSSQREALRIARERITRWC